MFGAREWPIQAHAAAPWRACDLDARKLLTHADLQVRIRLAVLQIFVELRPDVFDEPILFQQRIDFGIRQNEIDVRDVLHQLRRA
jgi:hypothetical protein